MKTLSVKTIAALVMLICSNAELRAEQSAYADRHVRPFYASLTPYGEWIRIDGLTVWKPFRQSNRWRPYSEGRWVWSDYGWYWISDEPFGWATYHYGRWFHDDWYGWVWLPDDTWGPAWVEWRYSNDYVGWAPLSPYAMFRIEIGIQYSRHWVTPNHYWCFIPNHKFGSRIRYRDGADEYRVQRLIGTTRAGRSNESENGRIVNHGIERNWLDQHGRSRFERYEVRETGNVRSEGIVQNRDGSSRTIEVYRPRQEEFSNTGSDLRIRTGTRRSSLELQDGQRREINNDNARGSDLKEPNNDGRGVQRRTEESGNTRHIDTPAKNGRTLETTSSDRPRVREIPQREIRPLARPTPPARENRSQRESATPSSRTDERANRRR